MCESCSKLQIEYEVLAISARDASTVHENTIRELRRLLEKEANVVRILNSTPDPMTGCPDCAKNFAQVRAVREGNAAEYKWTLHFIKYSKNLQLELQTALTDQKLKYMQLKCQFDELKLKQTDPHGRDKEVIRLRAELDEARLGHLNANQTALSANRVTDTLRKELDMASARLAAQETELNQAKVRIGNLEEAVDAYRRVDELKDCKVSECSDYLCRKRLLDQITKQKELCEQLREVQLERIQLQNLTHQIRHDAEHMQAIQPPPKKVSRTAALVADLACAPGELLMNLRSFFTVFPGWSSEELDDGAAFADFVNDLHANERADNLRWILAACNNGQMPQGDLAGSKLTRKGFSACLKAIGGVAKKRGSGLVWTNVRQNRSPIHSH